MYSNVKRILSALTLIVGLVGCSSEESTPSAPSTSTPNTSTSETTPTPSEGDVNAEENVEEVLDPEALKDLAIQIDTDLMILLGRSDELMDAMREGLTILANGGCTISELYQMTSSILEQQEEIYKLIGLYDPEVDTLEYKNSAMTYVRNLSEAAEVLMEYLDTQSVSSEAEYLEIAEYRTTLAFDLIAKRMAFLSACGIPDDEILEITGAGE